MPIKEDVSELRDALARINYSGKEKTVREDVWGKITAGERGHAIESHDLKDGIKMADWPEAKIDWNTEGQSFPLTTAVRQQRTYRKLHSFLLYIRSSFLLSKAPQIFSVYCGLFRVEIVLTNVQHRYYKRLKCPTIDVVCYKWICNQGNGFNWQQTTVNLAEILTQNRNGFSGQIKL